VAFAFQNLHGTKTIYAWIILNLFYLAVAGKSVFCNVKRVTKVINIATHKSKAREKRGHAPNTRSVEIQSYFAKAHAPNLN